jgi:hypothetical protein
VIDDVEEDDDVVGKKSKKKRVCLSFKLCLGKPKLVGKRLGHLVLACQLGILAHSKRSVEDRKKRLLRLSLFVSPPLLKMTLVPKTQNSFFNFHVNPEFFHESVTTPRITPRGPVVRFLPVAGTFPIHVFQFSLLVL